MTEFKIGETYVVNDATWLNKFKEWDKVQVLTLPNEIGEVRVYKLDWEQPLPYECNDDDEPCDSIHRSDAWNKIQYTIRASRLRPLFYPNNEFCSTQFQLLANKKTFTDASIGKAEELYDFITNFAKDLVEFKVTLENTASNLRALSNDLMAAVETKDAKAFNRLMKNCKSTVEFLSKDAMFKDLIDVMNQFDDWEDIEDEFNPIDLVG